MIGDKENSGFGYLYRIKLLPTFSYISILVSVHIGRFTQNGSHWYGVIQERYNNSFSCSEIQQALLEK